MLKTLFKLQYQEYYLNSETENLILLVKVPAYQQHPSSQCQRFIVWLFLLQFPFAFFLLKTLFVTCLRVTFYSPLINVLRYEAEDSNGPLFRNTCSRSFSANTLVIMFFGFQKGILGNEQLCNTQIKLFRKNCISLY